MNNNPCRHGRTGYCFDCIRERHNQEALDGKYDDIDDDIIQARRFRSMHGTDSCWNCDSDYSLHVTGYCPSMDDDGELMPPE